MKKPAQAPKAATGRALSHAARVFFLKVVAIVSLGLWIYWPVLRGDWLWDDDTEITNNAVVRSASGLWTICFEPGSQVGYAPFKVAVEWWQWHLWGNDTLGYHVTNLVLHLLSALLLWRLFFKLAMRSAWLGGFLFAVHPLMVESVAWISELKNTLSLPPFLLAMIFYIDYDNEKRRRDYLIALGLFLVAMLCKPSMALFPVVILLYAWWKRGRIEGNDLKESVPFFLISLILGIVALLAGTGYRQVDLSGNNTAPGGMESQLAVVGLAIAFFISKIVWPVSLLPIYPDWQVNPPSVIDFLPWPFLLAVLFVCWRNRHRWGKHVLFGLGFFLIMLLPVLGLMATKYASMIWSLDHLIYIPVIGLIGLWVAGMDVIAEAKIPRLRVAGVVTVTFIVMLMAWLSHTYAAMFTSEETLYHYTLERNPEAWPARNNLGYILMQRGQAREAIQQFTEAIQLRPDYVEAQNNLGFALAQIGQPVEAIKHFQAALQIRPDFAAAQYNWGVALVKLGQVADGISHFQEALRLQPSYAAVESEWGNALLQLGQFSEAVEHYQNSLRMNSDDPIVHYNCGNALISLGRLDEAVAEYQEAVRLKPDFAVGQNNLGAALLHEGRIPEAIMSFQKAVEINPNYAEAHDDLGVALYNERRYDEAIDQYQQAFLINPKNIELQDNWGAALAQMGQLKEAGKHFQMALSLKPNNAVPHFDWANALLYAGQYPDAIEQYQQAIRLNPGYANAYGNWAIALSLMGRKAEAIKQLEVAIHLDPNNASLRDNLAKLQMMPSKNSVK